MMQAVGESLALIYASLRQEHNLDESTAVKELQKITASWAEDEVVGSYLLELLKQGLADQKRFVQVGDRIGGGESGNWGLREAKRLKISSPLLAIAAKERFRVSWPEYFSNTVKSYLNQSYKFAKKQKQSFQDTLRQDKQDTLPENNQGLIKDIRGLLAYTMEQILYEGLGVIYQALRRDCRLDDKEAVNYLGKILEGWCHGTIIRSFMLERLTRQISTEDKSLDSLEKSVLADSYDTVLEYARKLEVPILLLNISAKKRFLSKENKGLLREVKDIVDVSEGFRRNETESFMSRIVSYLRWLFGRHPYTLRQLEIMLKEGLNAIIKHVRSMAFVSFEQNPENLAQAAKLMFERAAKQAIDKRGKFTVALCGGRAPKAMFELLKDADIDWSKTHIFWGDERPRRPDVGQTNYELAYETFLKYIDIPEENIHRINLDTSNYQAEAARYTEELQRVLGYSLSFDLMVLGAGADGHIMSLFPNSEVFDKEEPQLVEVVTRKDTGFGYTMTPEVLRRAKKIMLLVPGEEKRGVINGFIEGGKPVREFPVGILDQLDYGAIYVLTDLNLKTNLGKGSKDNTQKGHPAFAFLNMPDGRFTLKDYCQKTGVPYSTARRDFNVLEELGLVAIHRASGGKPNEIECVISEDLKTSILQILKSYRNKKDLPKVVSKIRELKEASIIAQKLYTPLNTQDKRLTEDGYGKDGYGVPSDAAIDGSHSFEGNQGYYTEEGERVFLETVNKMKEFFKGRQERLGNKPIRYIIKTGIGGQHTPFAAIASVFNKISSESVIQGEYELGKNFEDVMEEVIKNLNIDWEQIAVIPSSKSGSTDETMMVFVEIFYILLKHIAQKKGLDGEGFARLVLDTLHEINFIAGKEKKGSELFKLEKDSLITLISQRTRLSYDQVKDILGIVLGNMFFETTDRADKSRLSAFMRNSGLDKELDDDAPGFGAMFDNVGGRWTADLHMMTFLAYYNLDAEKYWDLRRRAIEQVRQGMHAGNNLGNKILDEDITDIALVVPAEFFWFGKSIEQNFNESIWQDGFANLITIKQSHWKFQKQHYENKSQRLVINLSEIDINASNVYKLNLPLDVSKLEKLDLSTPEGKQKLQQISYYCV